MLLLDERCALQFRTEGGQRSLYALPKWNTQFDNINAVSLVTLGVSPTMSNSQPTNEIVPSDPRYPLIAEAAYFRAERRGFRGGCPIEDWLEAEREISQQFVQPTPSPRVALVFLERIPPTPSRAIGSTDRSSSTAFAISANNEDT